ncbi:hypothetical protein [Sporomusa malonica]|uniref:Uncharacterized protein n=1 Tax=Sporomusa malonica TaxID=112901 RepID=A0A1W2F8E6_9FIRM|nr:hypothetical protein [Sporomusa malonica]SMD18217.1 hypothetical protein SAMN04488500_1581 [Sporomusa malonica]
MKNYDYKLLLEDLGEGREIEFKYNEASYGIVHFSEGWFFVADNKRISEYYKNPHELVETICIGGKKLEELFNGGVIPDEGFYIL